MNIRRFFGKNSHEALSMVRMALGDNAIILSNRAVNGGNQIMACKEQDMNVAIARQSKSTPYASKREQPADNLGYRTLEQSKNGAQNPDIAAKRCMQLHMMQKDTAK